MSVSVKVAETFVSLQGESTWAGLPCYFIRLAGCNLRCSYCDTRYAYEGGRETTVHELVAGFRASRAALAEITGGEPLLQDGFRDLASRLRDCRRGPVLVETNGSRDLSVVPDGVIAIMDLKCPDSGETAAMDLGNLTRLRPADEVKFVMGSRGDFDWACEMVRQHALPERCHAVLFSPVFGSLEARTLGDWVLESGLPVRLQIPLHKVLGVK